MKIVRIITLVVLVILVIVYLRSKKTQPISTVIKQYDENNYQIGKVRLDKLKKEIYFDGKISKTTGWAQFLIYVHGYKWLKDESAIVSSTKLLNLQKAFALLDWELWDDLWQKKSTDLTKKVSITIEVNKKKYRVKDFIKPDTIEDYKILELKDWIFLGSPYFDTIVLESSPAKTCSSCPIYDLERESLIKQFKRIDGKTGYFLNQSNIPPAGTKVKIIIKCKIS